ncbi:hypothetical protein HAL1_11397, partial [Halomonas sp. HAL1]
YRIGLFHVGFSMMNFFNKVILKCIVGLPYLAYPPHFTLYVDYSVN